MTYLQGIISRLVRPKEFLKRTIRVPSWLGFGFEDPSEIFQTIAVLVFFTTGPASLRTPDDMARYSTSDHIEQRNKK